MILNQGFSGGHPAIRPIVPSPVKKFGVNSALRASSSRASRKGRSTKSRSSAGFAASAPIARAGPDQIARLFLELLDGLGESDSLSLEVTSRRAEVGLFAGRAECGTDPSEPLLALRWLYFAASGKSGRMRGPSLISPSSAA